jgi:hypothetical protein
MTAITPFRISVTDAVLADLKARRRNTSLDFHGKEFG